MRSHPEIPDSVRRLIVDQIPSVERLEVLILLYNGRKHAWTLQEIQDQIRSTPDSIRQNLAALVHGELATPDPAAPTAVRYRPGSAALESAVAELTLVYRTRRVAVIELIYADRGPKSFSDAFKLGRPDDR